MKKNNCNKNKCWGGKRECAGRKRTCRKKVSFNRRINEDVLNILREYAQNHNIQVLFRGENSNIKAPLLVLQYRYKMLRKLNHNLPTHKLLAIAKLLRAKV